MNDMGRIDPMYQFSLDAYIELFCTSIDKSLKHPRLDQRITYLNDFHTFAVYQYTCRGLFERHKLLFSFQMCAKIMEAAQKLNLDEYNFFLRGGVVRVLLGGEKGLPGEREGGGKRRAGE
jgi:dynein heavy chain